MPPRNRRANCQICAISESKYTCSGCSVVYCSVSCYKQHKESSCRPTASDSALKPLQPLLNEDIHLDGDVTKPPYGGNPDPSQQEDSEMAFEEPKPLRPLTSLNWPYVPEESAYPDPLKRDDPKPLQLHQYEAIATSAAIRQTLTSHPNLPALLTSIDRLRGPDREHALQRALGVTAPELRDQSRSTELSDDVLALRALAEAVEAAVRGGKEGVLGLDWGE